MEACSCVQKKKKRIETKKKRSNIGVKNISWGPSACYSYSERTALPVTRMHSDGYGGRSSDRRITIPSSHIAAATTPACGCPAYILYIYLFLLLLFCSKICWTSFSILYFSFLLFFFLRLTTILRDVCMRMYIWWWRAGGWAVAATATAEREARDECEAE